MNTERVPTPGERELATYRAEIRAMRADEVDLLRVEEGIVARLKAIGAEMLVEAMKRADTDAVEVLIDGERCGGRRTRIGDSMRLSERRTRPGLGKDQNG